MTMQKKDNTNYIMAKGTMTFETFTNLVRDALEEHFKDCTVEVKKTNKNNGVVLHGIRITEPGSSVSPCIYLEEAYKDYQEGRDFHEIVMLIADNYRQSGRLPGFDIRDIQEYERAKEKLCLKVINTDLNRKLLSDVPHVPFCDLSVVFYIFLDRVPDQNANVLVSNQMMDVWGVDTDTLYEQAVYNTPRLLQGTVVPIQSVIKEFFNDGDREIDDLRTDTGVSMLYVATNAKKANGAAVFLYDTLLSDFAGRIGGDFYIIPSSIHELLFLPEDQGITPEDIRKMVSDVNASCVSPEEILSDNVYCYRRGNGLVEIA